MLGVATSFVPNLVSGSQMLAAKTFKQRELTEGYVITVTSALSSAIALCWLRRLKEVIIEKKTIQYRPLKVIACMNLFYRQYAWLVLHIENVLMNIAGDRINL